MGMCEEEKGQVMEKSKGGRRERWRWGGETVKQTEKVTAAERENIVGDKRK